MIDIELVEQGACGAFASARSTVPSLSGSRESSAEAAKAGEALVTNIAGGTETASKDASVKVFTVVNLIEMLLEMDHGTSATLWRLALLHSGFRSDLEPPLLRRDAKSKRPSLNPQDGNK